MNSSKVVKSKNKKPRFQKGDAVRVLTGSPVGHCRTPHYFRGVHGLIERHCGSFPNPEELAYGRDGMPEVDLYRVQARMTDTWNNNYSGSSKDSVVVEIYDHWLEPLN